MKLLKLIVYLGFGYLAYEFIQGLFHGSAMRAAARSRDLHRALNEDPGRMNITGPGQGMAVETHDAVGGQGKHRVGRGVVRT
jgi:hypothetical protein